MRITYILRHHPCILVSTGVVALVIVTVLFLLKRVSVVMVIVDLSGV